MIFAGLFGMLFLLLEGIVGLFPSYALPASIRGAGESIGASLAGANQVFPIVLLGVCLGLIVALVLVGFVVDLVLFIYRLIPLKFT